MQGGIQHPYWPTLPCKGGPTECSYGSGAWGYAIAADPSRDTGAYRILYTQVSTWPQRSRNSNSVTLLEAWVLSGGGLQRFGTPGSAPLGGVRETVYDIRGNGCVPSGRHCGGIPGSCSDTCCAGLPVRDIPGHTLVCTQKVIRLVPHIPPNLVHAPCPPLPRLMFAEREEVCRHVL